MRKQLLIMNEEGFYLPYVSIISVIFLAIISISLIVYKNEQETTALILEHVQVETIIQMGRAQFKEEEANKNKKEGQVMYEFPNGSIFLKYRKENEDIYYLDMEIVTSNAFIRKTDSRLRIQIN